MLRDERRNGRPTGWGRGGAVFEKPASKPKIQGFKNGHPPKKKREKTRKNGKKRKKKKTKKNEIRQNPEKKIINQENPSRIWKRYQKSQPKKNPAKIDRPKYEKFGQKMAEILWNRTL